MAGFSSEDPEAANKMRAMFGPGQADQGIRHAIQMVWMMLPDDRKTIDELEAQFRRLAERAMQDLREDFEAFGLKQ